MKGWQNIELSNNNLLKDFKTIYFYRSKYELQHPPFKYANTNTKSHLITLFLRETTYYKFEMLNTDNLTIKSKQHTD